MSANNYNHLNQLNKFNKSNKINPLINLNLNHFNHLHRLNYENQARLKISPQQQHTQQQQQQQQQAHTSKNQQCMYQWAHLQNNLNTNSQRIEPCKPPHAKSDLNVMNKNNHPHPSRMEIFQNQREWSCLRMQVKFPCFELWVNNNTNQHHNYLSS